VAEVGKIRIRLPSSIKAGDIVQARTLVIHPMERVERDAQGKLIQRNYSYIHTVIVTYLGKTIVTFETASHLGRTRCTTACPPSW